MKAAVPAAAVRPYQAIDRKAVRRIYADTAFFGRPVEAFFDDRTLFADLGVSLYTDHYPDHAFVAQDGGEVVGYILGSPRGDAEVHRLLLPRLPRIAWGLGRGRYRVGRRTIGYLWTNARAGLGGQLLEIRDPTYPANLHINLIESHRGRGLGGALMRAYLEGLRVAGVTGVHAVTTDRNPGAARFFEGNGFRLLQARTTSVWRSHLGREVQLLAYGLRLE